MRDPALMKRLTNLRDDLVEAAYLPSAIPARPSKPKAHPFKWLSGSGWPIAAGIALCLVLSVIMMRPMLTDWLSPPLTTDQPSDTTGDEVEEPSEEPTEAETLPPVELSVEITPSTARPVDLVTIKLLMGETELEWVPLFSPVFTYASIPVSADVFSYVPEPSAPPFEFTLAVPLNAPAGEYDLSVYCEGHGQTSTFGGVLSIEMPEEVVENPHVWITSQGRTVYPHQHYSGGQYVWYEKNVEDIRNDFWSITYADGIPYALLEFPKSQEVITVVYDASLTEHYSDQVYNRGSIHIYDADFEYVSKLKKISEAATSLTSGVYFFIISGDYYQNEDRYVELLRFAQEADLYWGGPYDTYFQTKVIEAYQKDPTVFTDKLYCEHVIRVIIP